MSRYKGSLGACTGLTDTEVEIMVQHQYNEFCRYRHELVSRMPDRRISLFSKRVFKGDYFEQE